MKIKPREAIIIPLPPEEEKLIGAPANEQDHFAEVTCGSD